MAAAQAPPLVTVEEYLNSAWHPDKEYVDGILVERSMPTYPHSILQPIVCSHFWRLRFEFGFGVAASCRVEIIPGSRYRIPDVLICSLPVNITDRALRTVPLAVIEVFSPEDRTAHQMARFREYWNRGVRQIISFDPESYTSFRYTDGALIETEIHHIELPDGRHVPFSSQALLDELQQELARER